MVFEKNAFDVWNDEVDVKGIVSLCKDLDDALDSGFPLQKITEIVGSPGCGKTQICLQLCVTVQIPKYCYGLEGAAVFIDTNCGFTVNRLRDIATATSNHCDRLCRSHNIAQSSHGFSVDKILANIHVSFCRNIIDLVNAIHSLEDLLRQKQNIRLIVIDSFSYLFRHCSDTTSNYTQLTYQLLGDLETLATNFNCAIVLTNEITTRVLESNEIELVPALGDSHGNRVHYQITVGKESIRDHFIIANVDKSFFGPEKRLPLKITKSGVRPLKQKKIN